MGVWIETAEAICMSAALPVTPCMGVWIETRYEAQPTYKSWSHPVWVCGLKHIVELTIELHFCVTPCMGVWIETLPPLSRQKSKKSHPVWVCGLKHKTITFNGGWLSHTLYGCVD